MTIIKDVCSARKYTKDGEEKTAWTKLGVLIEKDDGRMSIKLEALPLPNENGEVWLNVFEQKSKEESARATPRSARSPTSARSQAEPDFDDEIPF